MLKSPKCYQLTNNKGNYIANQFVIDNGNGEKYFQSYSSIIVFKDSDGQIWLDPVYWNYSRTTSKYRSLWLGENTDETKRKIKAGVYKMKDLNADI